MRLIAQMRRMLPENVPHMAKYALLKDAQIYPRSKGSARSTVPKGIPSAPSKDAPNGQEKEVSAEGTVQNSFHKNAVTTNAPTTP